MSEGGSNLDVAKGAVVDGVHRFPVRVYFEDTDTGGIVYHANYLKFMERARTEMLRLCGLEQSTSVQHDGVGYAVRSCNIEYLMPAVLDDVLEVRSTLRKIGGAYLDADQDIWRGREKMTEGRVRAVCINERGAPRRHPRDIISNMQSLISVPTNPDH